MSEIWIESKRLGDGCYIIAEAGVNHNGDVELAQKMVDKAKRAGCNAIKFQTFSAKRLTNDKKQRKLLQPLELNEKEFRRLKEYCDEKQITFLSTPFGMKDIDFLEKIGVAAFKIASGYATENDFLNRIGKTKKPVLLSTGMADGSHVQKAIIQLWNSPVVVMHCTSSYPVPMEEVNLKVLKHYRYLFDHFGYSDHTIGTEVAVAAVTMGACVLEKHFTLDKKMKGPDHHMSVDPRELSNYVLAIRNIEKAMGDGEKRIMPSEAECREMVKKRRFD